MGVGFAPLSPTESDGGVFGFGDAGFHGSLAGKALAKPIVGIASMPDGGGYWLVGADGGVFGFGDAGFYGSLVGTALAKPIVGIVAAPDGAVTGWWGPTAVSSVSVAPPSTDPGRARR